MAALMTREQILGAQDIGYEDVDLSDVPGWGIVRIKDLTAAERDRIEAGMVEERKQLVHGKIQTTRSVRLENVRATFCAACICDETLQPIFSRADIVALGAKSALALSRLFTRIQERNALTDADVEELAADFLPGQNGDSPTS